MTYRECLLEAEKRLRGAGIEEAASDSWLLFSWVFQMSRASYYMDMNRACPDAQKEQLEEAVLQRCSRIPLQHIIGTAPFMGFDFEVNEYVLTPRADTEVLTEKALDIMKSDLEKKKECSSSHENGAGNPAKPLYGEREYRVLDMCTGSGCIAISLYAMAREAAENEHAVLSVTAVDISEQALSVAARNNERLCAGSVHLVQSNLFEALSDTEEFDIIVSNPPYIRSREIDHLMPEVKDHEPRIALDGMEDGVYFYRMIVDKARSFLKHGGYLLFEIGYDQGESVPELLKEAGYSDIEVIKDLAGLDRVVMARYEIGRI
ncbi:MAG: peptide chain release factor N(5)-glutamine methyltransferase [Lachnospiraceae bacterium]|nr:peptide chain release factor N(5)-glutamine methyltransferase [Lachnospiraceae bacterium]